jgi:hypothetical protein
MAMPDLVYGTEESEENLDEQSSIGEIKPRPKPRIPKFKPAEVRLCCAEIFTVETAIHELPDPADMPPAKKFRRSRKFAKTPTASIATSPSKFQAVQATVGVAECSSVAEVRSQTPLVDHGEIGATSTTTWCQSHKSWLSSSPT